MAPLAGVSIVLPCFDEEDNVAGAIRAASAAAASCAEDYEVVVVDDGSRDATAEIARACVVSDPRVRLVTHAQNRGYGEALRTGLAAARMPWVLLTDADLQFDLDQLAELVPLTVEAELIAGRRVQRSDPLMRRVNAGLWNRLVRSLFGLPVRDVDCAFKLVRTDVVRSLMLRSRGAMVSTELIVKAAGAGARVREVDVRHRPRLAGRQSGASPRVVGRAFRELAALHGELRAVARTRARAPRVRRVAPLVALLALAAGLRLGELGHVGGNAFYDAAVRSMSRSWHNLFFGAYDPAAMTAIDKAPVDLWLQVASVKLLGFNSLALHLPEALGAIAAVGLVYGVGCRLFGRTAGIAAAAALAVLPVAVLTGRSDTMDSLMSALVVLAAWLIVRGAQAPAGRRSWWLAGAGAALGAAFNVKLAEALIPLPALALLAWLTFVGPGRRRVRPLLAGAGTFVAVSLSWLVAVALAPGPKPFPIGSQDGSAWNVVLVFDGLARLGLAPAANPHASGSGAGPLALFGMTGAHLGALLGVELLSALLIGGAALALARRRSAPRLARAGVAFLIVWIGTAVVVFGVSAGVRIRYLEALAPAVALALGAALAALARAAAIRPRAAAAAGAALPCTILLVGAFALAASHPPTSAVLVTGAAALAAAALARARPGWSARTRATMFVMLGLVGLLAIPTATSLRLVQAHASDSGNPGGMPLGALARVSDYLADHRHGARYELATAAAAKAGALIARDGQPVLVLTSAYGIPLVSARQLADDVRDGEVRYLLAGGAPCRASDRHATGCAPAVRWAHAHGTDVSSRAGAPRRGMVLRLTAPHRSARPSPTL